ncbi:MAG: helix-turn-helix domain-containing protein [Rhodospirillales bacterium]|nr:helix-turn-helix domain-containing protein [Rhodospirillales bacterium]
MGRSATKAIGGLTMRNGSWTSKAVAERLEEAAATLRRLPPVRVRGFYSAWPRIVGDVCEAVEPDEVHLGPPAPAAIDRMDQALRWLHWLEPDETRLVWLRAEGVRWKVITSRFRTGRSTLWRRWTGALIKIAGALNRAELHCRTIDVDKRNKI